MQARLVGRELRSDLLRRLDHPQVEDLGLVQQMVVIAHALAQLGGGIPRITRDNAVHKRRVHAAGLLEPGAEVRTQVPQVDVLADAFLQVFSVLEDQFAREDDETLRLVTLEVLPAVVQQLGKLTGIGRGRSVVQLAGRIEGDARLRRVGDDETHLRLFDELQIALEILIGAQAPADDVDQVDAVHGLAVLESLEIQVIQAVLLVEPADHALLDGLHHDDGAAKIGLLVGLPDDPLDERAKEVAFAELDYFLSVPFGLRCRGSV